MTIGRIPSVEGGIQPTIVTAKGDLIVATGNATLTRQPVGSDGQVLVADSTQADGVAWQSVATPFAAGKNKIINGDFSINQRNLTSASINAGGSYNFDRFFTIGVGNGSYTASAQNFTLGSAPVSGYEGRNFYQIAVSGESSSSSYGLFYQAIESVRTFAGQTVTISFWARATSGTPNILVYATQEFGGGGSPSSPVITFANVTAISTSWARYSFTLNIPSISGKTIGTNNNDNLRITILFSAGSGNGTPYSNVGIQNNTFQFWGIQAEAGAVATAFQTATGTLQGELAACQRYYYRLAPSAQPRGLANGQVYTANNAFLSLAFPVEMRTRPTAIEQTGTAADYNLLSSAANSVGCNSVPAFDPNTSNRMAYFTAGTASTLTAGNATSLISATTSAYLGWSAEL